ncbi:hypothetical protein VITU102760_00020 [Vibrio tubiashii]
MYKSIYLKLFSKGVVDQISLRINDAIYTSS